MEKVKKDNQGLQNYIKRSDYVIEPNRFGWLPTAIDNYLNPHETCKKIHLLLIKN